MDPSSVRRRSFKRALSVRGRDKDGAPTSSSLGLPVGGAKPLEVYGFVGSIGSLVSYAVYIIWAYTPESWLHALGITYYPSRYWAIAIPSYVIISVLFICVLYVSFNFLATNPPQSRYTLYDEYTRPSTDLTLSRFQASDDERQVIPSFSDMPITEVNALLLGPAMSKTL
ncbi:phosphatidylinositol N-acetylglucosaminyltransferase subunit P [Marchantia polymorpha subsp. ruderalis]|uniref:PIG-P domain-containing protein n=1 Tax=Marchantia polymorpha TaxID=3197 RepID=A0A2R6X867_MARPO|nr:hypothetical protein MARPO_0030s0033 [Marchantia polymorpha]BBN20171.1 hypothetical protein Mp_8g17000 [Marchantia polymorpha subsp. ruderalis]|eukprot:PTQ42287.1 hypothetical protein MARPO_0030s0033 [Marchantia polymorpha]